MDFLYSVMTFLAKIIVILFLATLLFFGIKYLSKYIASEKDGVEVIDDEGQINSKKKNIHALFEEPRECVSTNNFLVVEVLDSGDAIAEELHSDAGEYNFTTDLVVVFLEEGENSYYCNQKIKMPKGKCARQVGIFKSNKVSDYSYRGKMFPIVKIME